MTSVFVNDHQVQNGKMIINGVCVNELVRLHNMFWMVCRFTRNFPFTPLNEMLLHSNLFKMWGTCKMRWTTDSADKLQMECRDDFIFLLLRFDSSFLVPIFQAICPKLLALTPLTWSIDRPINLYTNNIDRPNRKPNCRISIRYASRCILRVLLSQHANICKFENFKISRPKNHSSFI